MAEHSEAEEGGTFQNVLSRSNNDNVVFMNGKPVLVAQPLTVVRALTSTGGARVTATPANPNLDEFDACKTPMFKVKEEPREEEFHACKTPMIEVKEEPREEEEPVKTVSDGSQRSAPAEPEVVSDVRRRSMLAFDDFLKATNTKVASVEESLKSMEVEPPIQTAEEVVEVDNVRATQTEEVVDVDKVPLTQEAEAVRVGTVEEPSIQVVAEGSDAGSIRAEKKAVSDDVEVVKVVKAVSDYVEVVKVVKKEAVEEKKIPNLEDGEFPEEPGWSLLGRKVEVAISTAKGVRRLVDNEIVHFNFPLPTYSHKSRWIVRISTKRSGEVLI